MKQVLGTGCPRVEMDDDQRDIWHHNGSTMCPPVIGDSNSSMNPSIEAKQPQKSCESQAQADETATVSIK